MKSFVRLLIINLVILLFTGIGSGLANIGRLEPQSEWTATFFPNKDLIGPGTVVTGIKRINFAWGANPPVVNGNPVAGITGRPYSVRFTSIQNLTPGEYVSILTSMDGARMFIDGTKVYDHFTYHGPSTNIAIYTITSNSVNVTIEYFASGGAALIHLSGFYLRSEAPPEILALLNAPRPAFTDNRRNADASASAIVYCSEKDVHIYGVNKNSEGYLAFTFTADELEEAKNLVTHQSQNIQLKSIKGDFGSISLWLLTSGQLQLHAAGLPPESYKFYDFIFEPC
jgi:hypothetical protein